MSNKMMRLLAVLLGFALLATACGSDDTATPATTAAPTTVAADDAPETTEAESGLPDLGGRTVTVAIENAYLPFNYIDAATGQAGGWD